MPSQDLAHRSVCGTRSARRGCTHGWLHRRAKAPHDVVTPEARPADDQAVLAGLHRLIAIVQENPTLDEAEIVDALVRSGVERGRANRLVVFVEIAFGRYVTDGLGVASNPTYYRELDDGARQGPFNLMDRAEFRVAMKHRDHVLGLAGSKELAKRSAELWAVNEALNKGVDPKGGTLAPVVVCWEGE